MTFLICAKGRRTTTLHWSFVGIAGHCLGTLRSQVGWLFGQVKRWNFNDLHRSESRWLATPISLGLSWPLTFSPPFGSGDRHRLSRSYIFGKKSCNHDCSKVLFGWIVFVNSTIVCSVYGGLRKLFQVVSSCWWKCLVPGKGCRTSREPFFFLHWWFFKYSVFGFSQ